jgi:hypothetical protein
MMLDGWLLRDGKEQIYLEAVTLAFIGVFLVESFLHICAFKGLYF